MINLKMRWKTFLVVFAAAGVLVFNISLLNHTAAQKKDSKTAAQAEPLTALDKLEIMELAARFETALDAENEKDFLATFTEDGELIAFGAASKGRSGQRDSFYQMLNTFARGKRHCSMNQIIEGDSRQAVMKSYLVVFNRDDLQRGGSAAIKDTAVKVNGKWLLKSREINVDPSFQKLPQK